MEGFLPYPKHFSTIANHAGQNPNNWDSLCVSPPIVTSSTYKHYTPAEYKKYHYGRDGNPTRDCLEKCLAALENAKHAFCFASGVGSAVTLISLLTTGDHILCGEEIYGGVYEVFKSIGGNFGIETTMVDLHHIKNLENNIKSKTKMIYIETPTNPTLKVYDIKAIANIAKKHGILFVVDNTFLTPYLQRPLDLGADMSLYSVTKYLNGHSDVIMGALVTNSDTLATKLQFLQTTMGITPSPFDCYQALRGLKTLDLRLKKQSANSFKIATFLESHPKVLKVIHPCLCSHPQYEISKKQTSGHSGVVAFYIKGDGMTAEQFFNHLKTFILAGSLGGTHSLIAQPSVMTHMQFSKEQRVAMGITDNMIRVSIGTEEAEDLIEDLKQALDLL